MLHIWIKILWGFVTTSDPFHIKQSSDPLFYQKYLNIKPASIKKEMLKKTTATNGHANASIAINSKQLWYNCGQTPEYLNEYLAL